MCHQLRFPLNALGVMKAVQGYILGEGGEAVSLPSKGGGQSDMFFKVAFFCSHEAKLLDSGMTLLRESP